jgi:hypothetical protein
MANPTPETESPHRRTGKGGMSLGNYKKLGGRPHLSIKHHPKLHTQSELEGAYTHTHT